MRASNDSTLNDFFLANAHNLTRTLFCLVVINLIRTLTWKHKLTTKLMGSMVTFRFILLYYVQ
jgi:hypothetical protein